MIDDRKAGMIVTVDHHLRRYVSLGTKKMTMATRGGGQTPKNCNQSAIFEYALCNFNKLNAFCDSVIAHHFDVAMSGSFRRAQ